MSGHNKQRGARPASATCVYEQWAWGRGELTTQARTHWSCFNGGTEGRRGVSKTGGVWAKWIQTRQRGIQDERGLQLFYRGNSPAELGGAIGCGTSCAPIFRSYSREMSCRLAMCKTRFRFSTRVRKLFWWTAWVWRIRGKRREREGSRFNRSSFTLASCSGF